MVRQSRVDGNNSPKMRLLSKRDDSAEDAIPAANTVSNAAAVHFLLAQREGLRVCAVALTCGLVRPLWGEREVSVHTHTHIRSNHTLTTMAEVRLAMRCCFAFAPVLN